MGTDGALRGEKLWISNAPDADFYVTFARTTADAGARGVTAFLLPAEAPDLTAATSTWSLPTRSASCVSTTCDRIDSGADDPGDLLGQGSCA
jgi:alkylation response protein AidB-like acyl-CoA dehydrogenase